MAMAAQDIKDLILKEIPDALIDINDYIGDQDHYKLEVTAEKFRGKTRIQQHQIVYAALGGRVGDQLHALSLTTKIPD